MTIPDDPRYDAQSGASDDSETVPDENIPIEPGDAEFDAVAVDTLPETPPAYDDDALVETEIAAPEADSIVAEPAQDTISHAQSASAQQIDFGELTLAQLFGLFFRAPFATYNSLLSYAGTGTSASGGGVATLTMPETSASGESALARLGRAIRYEVTTNRPLATTILYVLAFYLALRGCIILLSGDVRTEDAQLADSLPWLVAGVGLWMLAEFARVITATNRRWYDSAAPLDNQDTSHDDNYLVSAAETMTEPAPITAVHPARVFAFLGAILFALITWFDVASINGQDNQFRPLGFWSWVISIIMIVGAFAPTTWTPDNIWRWFRDWVRGLRFNWTALALIGIMLIGAYFRLHNLDGVPPEMTSDHLEKLWDSARVAEGDRDIFFRNNGGREIFQMYAMALMAKIPGFGFDFHTLKLLAVIEALVTLPALWWMGRVVIGDRDRRLGNVVGLTLALLVAVSYWHVAITRLALRIILTPLVASLLLIFLSKAMRTNRRGYYILAGLTLGFGLYMYQAVRMLPLVVLAGVGIALLFHLRNRRALARYVAHLAVLVAVSFIIFVPLFRFSVDFPDSFWMRTAGRLLGDETITEIDQFGNEYTRNTTISERLDAFGDNLPILGDNIKNALLMYHWKGDVGWISGVPNYPVMDRFTGAFLIVGLAAWLVLMIRRPDPVYILVPLMVFIMLLPSALSIAAPNENPSATRTSGSLPPVYLMAALPLSLIALGIWQSFNNRRVRRVLAVGMVVLVSGLAYAENYDTYFDGYLRSYNASWTSHSAPGQMLRGFTLSDGAYGNAFLIGYAHWLDHRIVGVEGGILDWPNGIADEGGRIALDRVPDFIHDSYYCFGYPYPFDPERDLLFFYNQDDEAAAEQLQGWFPEGRPLSHPGQKPRDEYYTYRVPALGEAGFITWLDQYTTSPRCVG